MTDIEFAKAVAENVWKYVRSWDEQDQRYMWFSEEDSFEDRNIIEEVNSWEGFGRTVEAMAARRFVFIADDVYIGFIPETKRHCERTGEPPDFQWSRQIPNEHLNDFIWEAHQTALDAVNGDG